MKKKKQKRAISSHCVHLNIWILCGISAFDTTLSVSRLLSYEHDERAHVSHGTDRASILENTHTCTSWPRMIWLDAHGNFKLHNGCCNGFGKDAERKPRQHQHTHLQCSLLHRSQVSIGFMKHCAVDTGAA